MQTEQKRALLILALVLLGLGAVGVVAWRRRASDGAIGGRDAARERAKAARHRQDETAATLRRLEQELAQAAAETEQINAEMARVQEQLASGDPVDFAALNQQLKDLDARLRASQERMRRLDQEKWPKRP